MDALVRFLEGTRSCKFNWTTANCAIWVADWVMFRTGIDPALPLRGKAATADEWIAVLKESGGFMPAVGYAMDTCCFARTQSPQRGDVVLVSVPIGRSNRLPVVGTIAAICAAAGSSGEWPLSVCRSIRGLFYGRFPIAAGWSIEQTCKTSHPN